MISIATIAQIILTVLAWQNGWRWRSLLPIFGGWVMAFIVAIVIVYTENLEYDYHWIEILINTIIALSLGIMCFHKPKEKSKICQ